MEHTTSSASGFEDSMSSCAGDHMTGGGSNDCTMEGSVGAMDSASGMDGGTNKMEWSGSGATLQSFDCKLCSVKSRGMSEHLRHLSKVHFKHKLLSEMPKTAPYKCPWSGCEVTKKDRFNLALHYGMSHKMALKLVQEMRPEDALDEDVEASCKICHESFTAHRYLYTHLSDTHFQQDLDKVSSEFGFLALFSTKEFCFHKQD